MIEYSFNTTISARSQSWINTVQKCWGSNTSGQVGDGTTTQRLTPVSVLSGGIASYTYGSASHKHAVTALSSGESYTYDANGNVTGRVEGGLTDPALSVQERVETGELEYSIHECLQSLAPNNRTMLILIDIEGLSYEEAAFAAGVPLGTVHSRLARTRMALHQRLCNALASPHNSGLRVSPPEGTKRRHP